jgi:uncharacterized protein YjbJ (UPF0337 family)
LVVKTELKEARMGFLDDAKNKGEELLGQGKEGVGAATDNKDLEREGKADQASAGLKQGLENVKDGISDGIDKLRGK